MAWAENGSWNLAQISVNIFILETITVVKNYMMNGSVLESSNVEKDVSVMISNDLKCTSHTDYVVLKASRLLGMLHRSIQPKVKAIIFAALH